MASGLILGACLMRAADNGSATADCTDPPHSIEKTAMKRERLEGELFLDKTVYPPSDRQPWPVTEGNLYYTAPLANRPASSVAIGVEPQYLCLQVLQPHR